jgi:ribosomal protein S18 acetylase RimI-like enzyme
MRTGDRDSRPTTVPAACPAARIRLPGHDGCGASGPRRDRRRHPGRVLIRDVTDGDVHRILRAWPGHRRALNRRAAAARTRAEDLLIAVDAGQPIAVASIRWYGGCDGPRPFLYGIEVHPSRRNQGTGTALVRVCAARARADGHSEMSLDVAVTNHHATRLYQRLGFAAVRVHTHSWFTRTLTGRVTGTRTVDAILMRAGVPLTPGGAHREEPCYPVDAADEKASTGRT